MDETGKKTYVDDYKSTTEGITVAEEEVNFIDFYFGFFFPLYPSLNGTHKEWYT